MSKPLASLSGPYEDAPFRPWPGRRLILWDKDSTLADTWHRQPLIEKIKAGEATWTDYSLAATDDGLIGGTATLMRMLADRSRWHQYIVSGANCEAEPVIHRWAALHKLPFDALILRATGNHQPNAAFKIAVIKELRAMKMEPVLFVEDWPECAAEIRAATGVPTLVVNPCYPEGTLAPKAGA